MTSLWKFIPSRRWLFLPPIAIGLLTVISLAMTRKELKRVSPPEVPQPLAVVRVSAQPESPVAVGYGTARPSRVWTAIAEVGGKIVKTRPNLRSGIYVEAGELLVQIDDGDYKLRKQQRQSELAQAAAQVDQIRLSQESDESSIAIQEQLLAVRQSDVDRLITLRNRSSASQTEADLARAVWLQQMQTVQTLQNSLRLYPSQLASARANLSLAESRLAEAVRDVERTRIVAPYSGVLAEVRLEPGQYVGPGERLCEVHDVETVEVEAHFSMAQLSALISRRKALDPEFAGTRETHSIDAAALTATVTTRSGDLTLQQSGRPVRISEAIDDQTRTLGIVIQVDNHFAKLAAALSSEQTSERTSEQSADAQAAKPRAVPIADVPPMPLRAGAYCEVRLASKSADKTIMIPRSAIEDSVVYVVGQDNRLQKRNVIVGFTVGDRAAIVQGLGDGDLVAIRPTASAMDGKLVKPEPVQPQTGDSEVGQPELVSEARQ